MKRIAKKNQRSQVAGRYSALALAMLLAACTMTGCGNAQEMNQSDANQVESSGADNSTSVSNSTEENQTENQTGNQEENSTESPAEVPAEEKADNTEVTIRVGSLKGPTTLGLLGMMDEEGYTFTMATAADEIGGLLVKGDLDIALVPANLAAILYQKTEGALEVIDINTLGVLNLVSADESIQSISDLADKTVYLTGKGTTPDYVMQYLLQENDLAEGTVTLEYLSEATEVAAMLTENPDAIGLLPQPFVTAACMQNDALSVLMDLNNEWEKVCQDGSAIVTGVTVARKAFAQENPDAVLRFLENHGKSVETVLADPETAGAKAEELGIVGKAAIAKKAIPNCHLVNWTGETMQEALSSYLQVLYQMDPKTVGGAMPDEAFYYVP